MLIIVEGADGSGKTTLVNRICSGGPYKKIHAMHRDVPEQYLLWLSIMMECSKSDEVYVMDRCFLSEWCYRSTINDKIPYMTLLEMSELLNIPSVIYVFCECESSYEMAQKRGEDYIKDKKQHDSLTECYKFIKNTIIRFCPECKCITYNFEKDDHIEFLLKLKRTMNV
jgi:thymidylate kinase